jgi:hypothetical protein
MMHVNMNLGNLLLNENAQYLSNFIDNPSQFITWQDVEFCMNNPVLYGLELINHENFKLPHSAIDLAREKRFLFDAVHDSMGMVITQYDHYNAKTKELCDFFEKTFDVNASIHVYCGLKASTSFKIHCDFPTNFIIQVEGECRWKVYGNRMSNLIDFHNVHHPIVDENDLQTIIDVVLKPGDGLYIPPRQYHCAFPSDKRISMSIPCWGRSKFDRPRFDRNTYSI